MKSKHHAHFIIFIYKTYFMNNVGIFKMNVNYSFNIPTHKYLDILNYQLYVT
jgi:hypothetical protein